MVAAESTTVLKDRVVLLNEDIRLLNERIVNLRNKDSIDALLIAGYEKQMAIMRDQRGIFEAEIAVRDKTIKKLKRKRFWTTLGGIAGMGGAFWLGSSL